MFFKLQGTEAIGRPSIHQLDNGRPPGKIKVNLYKTKTNIKDLKTLCIPVYVNGKETLGVVDTAAQVTVLKISLFEQIVPRPKTTTTIVLKGIGNFSEMDARLVPNACVTIGKSTIKWDVVVADIEDHLILGIDFLENQKAIINLTDYSIELRGEKVPSMVFSTIEKQQNKVYRVKTARKTIVSPHTDRISHDEEKV